MRIHSALCDRRKSFVEESLDRRNGAISNTQGSCYSFFYFNFFTGVSLWTRVLGVLSTGYKAKGSFFIALFVGKGQALVPVSLYIAGGVGIWSAGLAMRFRWDFTDP